jgi:hypothetical protein
MASFLATSVFRTEARVYSSGVLYSALLSNVRLSTDVTHALAYFCIFAELLVANK